MTPRNRASQQIMYFYKKKLQDLSCKIEHFVSKTPAVCGLVLRSRPAGLNDTLLKFGKMEAAGKHPACIERAVQCPVKTARQCYRSRTDHLHYRSKTARLFLPFDTSHSRCRSKRPPYSNGPVHSKVPPIVPFETAYPHCRSERLTNIAVRNGSSVVLFNTFYTHYRSKRPPIQTACPCSMTGRSDRPMFTVRNGSPLIPLEPSHPWRHFSTPPPHIACRMTAAMHDIEYRPLPATLPLGTAHPFYRSNRPTHMTFIQTALTLYVSMTPLEATQPQYRSKIETAHLCCRSMRREP